MEGILFTILLASTGLVGVRGETCDRNSLSLVNGCLVNCAEENICLNGQTCVDSEDCKDKNDICVDSSPNPDGLKCRNCNETANGDCRDGADCNDNSQCLSKVCTGGVCLANCVDEQICSLGQPCGNDNENCEDVNLVCKNDGTLLINTCQDCNETATGDCRDGADCNDNSQCLNKVCTGGKCLANCVDDRICSSGQPCGDDDSTTNDNINCIDVNQVCKIDVDIGKETCQDCLGDCRNGANCTANDQCQSKRCTKGVCVVGCEGACGLGEQCEDDEDCIIDFKCYLSPSDKDGITRCNECNRNGAELCREGAFCTTKEWCDDTLLREGNQWECKQDPNLTEDRNICQQVPITTTTPVPTEATTIV